MVETAVPDTNTADARMKAHITHSTNTAMLLQLQLMLLLLLLLLQVLLMRVVCRQTSRCEDANSHRVRIVINQRRQMRRHRRRR